MSVKSHRFLLVLAIVLCLILSAAAVSAKQSFTLINHSNCIVWVQIRADNGNWIIGKALVQNEMFTKEKGGTGIAVIKAGPTCAVDDCCYIRKINASPNLSGSSWRVDIYGDRLELVDNTTWAKQVYNAYGDINNCPACESSGASAGAGGPAQGATPRNAP